MLMTLIQKTRLFQGEWGLKTGAPGGQRAKIAPRTLPRATRKRVVFFKRNVA